MRKEPHPLTGTIYEHVGDGRKGIKAKQPPDVWYSAYQESKIRNFHRNYDKAMGSTGVSEGAISPAL